MKLAGATKADAEDRVRRRKVDLLWLLLKVTAESRRQKWKVGTESKKKKKKGV